MRPITGKTSQRWAAGILALALSACTSSAKMQTFENTEDDGLWQYSEISDASVFESDLLNQKQYSVSLWLKPSDNFVGGSVLFIGDDSEYVELSARGLNEEMFSGLTLSSKHGETIDWVVADGSNSMNTGQWNQIVLNFDKKNVAVYLNGERIAEGNLNHSVHTRDIRIGSDLLNSPKVNGGFHNLCISSSIKSEEAIQTDYRSHYAALLLDQICYPDQDHLSRDLWFMDNTIEGNPVTWTVEENPVMKPTGQLKDCDLEADVHTTARIDTEYGSAEKQFVFHTAGTSERALFEEDCKALNADLEGVMHSGITLPASENERTEISYEVISGNAHIEDCRLIKDSDAEREPVTLKAKCTYGGQTAEQTYTVTLLDEAYAYVMAYFNDGEEKEEGHLALSMDGVTWKKLNDSVITGGTSGTGRIRDPHLSRAKDGSFLIAATEGGNHPYAYVITSDDLMSFADVHRVLLSYPDQGLGMSGQKAWAPEIYYDNENDEYYLYYSDPQENAGSIYMVLFQPDAIAGEVLKTTYPTKLLDTGYPVIDGTVFTMNGSYWMIYKDERTAAQTIYCTRTDNLKDTFRICYDWQYMQLKRPVEGPLVFRDIHTGEYHIYADYFAGHTFLAGRFTDLGYDKYIDWSDTEIMELPEEDVRHGSVITITEKEYQRLIEHYGIT